MLFICGLFFLKKYEIINLINIFTWIVLVTLIFSMGYGIYEGFESCDIFESILFGIAMGIGLEIVFISFVCGIIPGLLILPITENIDI